MCRKIAILIFIFTFLRISYCYPEKTIELSFWQFLIPEYDMREILDGFEKTHPYIKVRMQQLNWRDGLDKITTSIAAGITSDICELGSTWVARFADLHVLYDLSDYIKPKEAAFFPDLLRSASWNGKFYGVPWVAGTRVLYYNKEIFKEAGLDPDKPPETWDQLYKYILTIASKCPQYYPFALPVGENYTSWQTFLPFLWSAGGDVFDEKTGNVIINSESSVAAFQFYQKISNYSLLARQSHIDRIFTTGKAAMIISGGWDLGLIARLNPQLTFGVARIPRSGPVHVSFAGGEILVIFKQTKHPKEAQMLIDYLVSPEVQMQIVKIVPSFIPTLKKPLSDPYFKSVPYKQIFLEQIKTAKSPPQHPRWTQIEEELAWAVEEAVFNKTDPRTVVEKLNERLKSIFSFYTALSVPMYSHLISFLVVFSILSLLIALIVFNILHHIKYRKLKRQYVRTTIYLYIFLFPWLALFFVFYLFPFLYSFMLSFTDYNPIRGYSSFCGMFNYFDVLRDPQFRISFLQTVYFALVTGPVSLVVALGCAVAIYKKIPLHRFMQAGLFAPISISVIVAASMFSYFFSSEGIINLFLDFFHVPRPFPDNWLMNERLALPAIMIMNIWSSFGFYMIIFTAGLHSIPLELLEASRIDGATSWQRFWYIVLPQLKPFIILVIVLNTIKAFQIFPEVFAMTQGGPHGKTLTIVYYLYKSGFQKFEMGKASAVGFILLAVIGIFLFLEVYFLKREHSYET